MWLFALFFTGCNPELQAQPRETVAQQHSPGWLGVRFQESDPDETNLLGFQQPVMMVTIAACFGALMLPLQCFMAIYLGERTLPAELKPGLVAKTFLRLTFLFQLLMAGLVIYFVAL